MRNDSGHAALVAAIAALEEQLKRRTEELTSVRAELDAERSRVDESKRLLALAEVAAGIAHEINNPLAIIKARTQHIRRVLSAEPPQVETALRFAGVVGDMADRVVRIIVGLRNLARDGSDDPFLPYSVNEVLHDAVSMCVERYKSHAVELRVQALPHDVQCHGRSVQLMQAVTNLLNNAFDAVVGGAAGARWVSLEAHDLGDSVRIAVADAGDGVPEDMREHIMQPFFTTKRAGNGLGLGLSISRKMIRDHGGDLRLEPGAKATTFVIELPKIPP